MQSKQSNQKTRICKICFKEIGCSTIHDLIWKTPTICHDCLLEFKPVLRKFKFEDIECFHLYFYNEKIQETLYQFKGCNDYELRTTFLEYYKRMLNYKFKNYVMIPAPSLKESDEQRGFNHVIEIFKVLNLKMNCCIHKIVKIKQAGSTKKQREKISNALVIDDVNLTNKKLLIVDDVFTTGQTAKTMINLLKTKNPKKIKVLLMAKTIDLDKRNELNPV